MDKEEKKEVVLPVEDDIELKIKSLEADKARLLEENANYQAGLIKERSKHGDSVDNEEEKLKRIVREELVNSQIGKIDQERDALFQKTLRENKELKLAQLNKTTVPTAMGVHSEAPPVRDTTIPPDQLAQFKAMGKTDKWIENYKKNLSKNSR